jgi:nucleotide-binding universal stress UspA family protein
MYRVIMVPVDGSTFWREAVFQGLRLAEKTNAKLRLVRVGSMPFSVAGAETVALESAAWETQRDEMLTQLYRLAAECRANTAVDVTATLEDGPIADSLCGHALRYDVDLIVMATHARRGMARVWLGSVADRLIRETGIPVLVVRPPSLATEIASGACFRRIVVALDGSTLAERSLRPALALAAVENAELTLLRVVRPEKNIPVGELQALNGSARARYVDFAQLYLSDVAAVLSNPRVHTEVVIADDIPEAILRFAEKYNADLIAIGTHGRGGLARAIMGSVADRIMSEGPLSTLVLHPSEQVSATLAGAAYSAAATVG